MAAMQLINSYDTIFTLSNRRRRYCIGNTAMRQAFTQKLRKLEKTQGIWVRVLSLKLGFVRYRRFDVRPNYK
jgi:hypothetical protein